MTKHKASANAKTQCLGAIASDGFTLIELLVAIFIIGVLTALLLSNILGVRQRADDTQRKSDLRQLKTAMRLYYNDNQSYLGLEDLMVPGTTFSNEDGSTMYMRQVPDGFEYEIYIAENGQGFRLVTELDNRSDQDIANSQQRCPVDGFEALSEGYGVNEYVVCED